MKGHLHILGICGTFMGSIAVLARQLGYTVTGCDQNVYPPMSTYLESQDIEIHQGFDAEQLVQYPDAMIVVGNVMTRGVPVLEAVLNQNRAYISGPQWFAEHVLQDKWVLMITGTHGKTTTSSMLSWVLECAGLEPGFLIGGIPENFGVSSRLGGGKYFVVEGDEYDTAFSDKRSKFIHYHAKTVVLNNLEFDHADIFEDVQAIQKQFHHLLKTLPNEGLVVHNATQPYLDEVLAQGCWTPCVSFGGQSSDWQAKLLHEDGSAFEVYYQQQSVGQVNWALLGQHNVENGLACIASAHHVGIAPEIACQALNAFQSVKRRLELRGQANGVSVYDDFAHHPTAIEHTLKGIKAHVGNKGRIFAVLEPRSNTMRMGYHGTKLRDSLEFADRIYIYEPPGLTWQLGDVLSGGQVPLSVYGSIDEIIQSLSDGVQPGDHIVVMSNGGFENIHEKILNKL